MNKSYLIINTLLFLFFSTPFFVQNTNSYEIFKNNDTNLNLSGVFPYNDGTIGLFTFEKHNRGLPIFHLFSTQNNTMVKNFTLKDELNPNELIYDCLGLFFNYFAILYIKNDNWREGYFAIINWNGEIVKK